MQVLAIAGPVTHECGRDTLEMPAEYIGIGIKPNHIVR
jgi:hypothetical protein